MIYVVDTSSFRVFEDYYPSRFPSFWRNVDALIREGRLISVREVKQELLGHYRKDNFLFDWISTNKRIFKMPSTTEGTSVSEIFKVPHFRQVVHQTNILNGTPVADPFLIAAAQSCNGCVVTQEKAKPNSAKIPNICEHFGVQVTNVEGMLEKENWSF